MRRGSITNILKTLECTHGYSFRLTKYRGTIYIAQVPLVVASGMWSSLSGHRFEHYMTGGEGSFDVNEDYYCVADTTLGNHRLLIHGEIDGIDRDMCSGHVPTTMAACIELKSGRRIDARKWWQQSAVFGIKEIVRASHITNGIVTGTEVIKVEHLEEMGNFDSKKMLRFAVKFFDWLKHVIMEENKVVYLVKYEPRDKKITCDIDTASQCFLTSNYLDNLFPTQPA